MIKVQLITVSGEIVLFFINHYVTNNFFIIDAVYPVEILSNVSKMWQAESSVELQEILVQEKLRQVAIKEEIRK